MSDYNLIKTGAIHADETTGGGVAPLDVAISGDAIKLTSAFLMATVRDRRRNVLVQQGTIAITNADAGPTKDSAALGTAVDITAAYVIPSIREKRTDGYYGASLKLADSTHVRATFHQPAAGDTIDADFQVVEAKPRRAATLEILDDSTVRLKWDGTLVAGESIDAVFYIFDFDNAGDDLKEVLFREEQLLGLQGYAKIQDRPVYDTPGNLVQYRVRAFRTAAAAQAATIDLADGDPLEPGEIARYQVNVDIDKTTNDRKSLVATRIDDILPNPDID